MALIVNLFGAPSSGKSTGAAYVFSRLKMLGVNAELVTEFVKDKVWEDCSEALKNQAYIFGQQYYRISRCADKVDVIITDSPLPFSILYNPDPALAKSLNALVMDVFNSYNNLNYLLCRTGNYDSVGRIHSEEESKQLHEDIKRLLQSEEIPYSVVDGFHNGYEQIVRDVLRRLDPNAFGQYAATLNIKENE